MRSGTYQGKSEDLSVEIRLEAEDEGKPLALSGDLFVGGKFLASLFCHEPIADGTRVFGPISFRGNSRLFTGMISVQADPRGLGSFQITVDLEGGHQDHVLGRLEWQGSPYRRISIEVDGVAGQPYFDSYLSRRGVRISLESAFSDAGIDAQVRVDSFSNTPHDEELRGYTYAEIHRAMQERRDVQIDPGRLQTHVFVCSYLAERNGRNVLGVMYDFGANDLNRRAREGVAVFGQHPMFSDPRVPDEVRRREFVYTVIHEVGHALNLTHSFDKGRPAALSWMNYPHLYPLGAQAGSHHDGSNEFWRGFSEGFDEHELRHLRHGTSREIAAGGFPFGVYEEGLSSIFEGGVAQPRRTSLMSNPLRQSVGVELSAATTRRSYQLGELVFLELSVRTAVGTSARIPDALDPSEGFVRIVIETPNGQQARYVPPLRLCARSQQLALGSGAEKRSHAIPLFLGANGPVFTDPGVYRIWAELGGIDGDKVAFADPVTVRIAMPDQKTAGFAETLWDTPDLLVPLYLQHPLSNETAWQQLEEIVHRNKMDKRLDHDAWSYLNYVGALGWLRDFNVPGRRSAPMNETKALKRIESIDPRLLPLSAQRRIRAVEKGEAPKTRQRIVTRPSEQFRVEIPPNGLFGQSGLDVPGVRDDVVNPFAIVVRSLDDSPAFADIVTWNIQHLHGTKKEGRIEKIAEYMLAFRCDFWALQEVGADGVEALVDTMNVNGDLVYAYLVTQGRDGEGLAGQQSACIYRTDTVSVRRLDPAGYFENVIEVADTKGVNKKREVFPRPPLLCDVRVKQSSSKVFDFCCAIAHLKSTDPKLKDKGTGMRAAAASELARWVADLRGNGAEQDFFVMGDFNAEEAQQGLAPFAEAQDLRLLSIGMKKKYGTGEDGAITRFASGRLLDHIVVTQDTLALMPKDDLQEQIIIRSDIEVSGFTKQLTGGGFAQYEFSDHLPVAARFILGKDRD